MTLAYDVARCKGTTHEECKTCRRTEPGCPHRQSFFSMPPIENGVCKYKIPVTEE